MKRKFYIPILVLCLCLYGCLGPWGTIDVLYESLITIYENVDYGGNVEVRSYPLQNRNHVVAVKIPTEVYAHYYLRADGWNEHFKQINPDWEIWHERHRELSRKNGDVGFDRYVDVSNGPFMHCVWNTDNLMTAMSIVSNADFDETHPAGTPLDDIVDITYYSYKSIIENDYALPEGRYCHSDCHYSVTKLLSEFESEDSLFMESTCSFWTINEYSFWLEVVQEPTLAMQHTFTVTIEFEHGEPYSFSFDMDFTSAE